MRRLAASIWSASCAAMLLAQPLPVHADGCSWTQLAPASAPSPRADPGIVYSTASNRVILFAGRDSGPLALKVYSWNGNTWTETIPNTVPSNRFFMQTSFDAGRGVAVIFSGAGDNTGDTWEWDGTDWTRRTPVHSPPARAAGVMAYDPVRGVSIMFGGLGDAGPLADTWEWDGADWTQIATAHAPAARYAMASAYDTVRGRFVVFGGYDGGLQAYGDTWEWDGIDWTQILPTSSPAPRLAAAAAFDAATSKVILHAGEALNPTTALSDTWAWDGSSWTDLGVTTPARTNLALSYDAARDRIVAFGGFDPNSNPIGDTWELTCS